MSNSNRFAAFNQDAPQPAAKKTPKSKKRPVAATEDDLLLSQDGVLASGPKASKEEHKLEHSSPQNTMQAEEHFKVVVGQNRFEEAK